MADSTPSNADFKLPEDLETLSQMRDQLSDYLNTLERNTDSVNAWLHKHQNSVIVGHHQLNRSVSLKNEKDALQALKDLGETAGFVLSMQDFKGQAEAAFGADSAVVKEIAKHTLGVPKAILEDLPEIKLPDQNAPATYVPPLPQPELPEAEPEKKRSMWNPATWFGKAEREEEEARKNAEAEAQRKIDEIKRHWRLVRSELIGLQSDRHYYVDSFMDWVGETLAPQKADEAEARKLMEKYQNPQFVIDLAVRDYAEVMEVKVGMVKERALLYSKTAALIDEQRIGEFAALLPTLFPKSETSESKQLKELLLQDYKVVSFAEMALDRVTKRDDQLLLLKTALAYEPEFKLAGAAAKTQVFERVLKEATAAQDPLDASALSLTLKKLGIGNDNGAAIIDLKNSNKTVFERLATRFNASLTKMQEAVGHVLSGLGSPAGPSEKQLAGFVAAVRAQDPIKLGTVLSSLDGGAGALSFKGLWNLTYPGTSLIGEISKAAKTTADLSALTDLALRGGLADEFKVGTNAVQGDAKNVLKFINEKIMPEHEDFNLAVLRRLIGVSFANAGLDQLRKELTRPGGWLEQVAASPLNAEGKLNWTAAFLEPWPSNIVKSNILAEAAQGAKNPDAKKALLSLESNLAGDNVRLDDGRILTNLDRIANIWYDGDTKVMRLTVNGTGHTMLDDVSPQMAKEVLTHIQRKAPFLQSEYDGLYNPVNLDRIVTTPQKTAIYWGNHTGMLNVPDETIATLHKHPDFLHVTNGGGQTHSINLKTIALLQPLSDGTHLLVDKYGAVQVLEGNVSLAAKDSLLDLSGTYFNPRNASILSLDADKKTVGFRAESKDFEDLLESVSAGQYFYNLELNAADFARAQTAVAAAPAIVSPNKGDLKNLHFNFETLGYMIYTDEREAGFSIRKNGPAKTPGFIATQEEALAKNIYAGLSSNPDLVTVGNVVTHKSLIDDAYYNADKQRFYMVLNNDILPTPAEDDAAYKALQKLAKEDGFMVVGASTVPNPSGRGTVEVPADIINLNRTVMQFYSEAQDKTFLVADNERFFYIGYDKQQAASLFDMLENQGLQDARAATPKSLAWTQKLGETAEALPTVMLRVTPSLTDLSREHLLQQAVGQPGENRAMPEPKKDFSIAAAPYKSNAVLEYPVRPNVAPTRKATARSI